MSIKDRIQKHIEQAMTVEMLIDELKKVPPKALVGLNGHFGEFHSMDKGDVHGPMKSYIGGRHTHTYGGNYLDWKSDVRVDVEVVEIHMPHTGEEPN